MNQPSIFTPANYTQAKLKDSSTSSGGGVINLQLIKVGQQLTQINQ